MGWDTYHEKTLGYNMMYEIYAAMDAYPLVNKNGRREDRKIFKWQTLVSQQSKRGKQQTLKS